MSLNWKLEKNESSQEFVSPDNRWHMSVKTLGDGKSQVYLSNYDLLGGPGALAGSQKECLAAFIANCDSFAQTLARVKAEAEELLAALDNQ